MKTFLEIPYTSSRNGLDPKMFISIVCILFKLRKLQKDKKKVLKR